MKLSIKTVVIALAISCGMANAAKPVKIYILAGQSNMNTFKHEVELLKKDYPDLEIPTKNLWYVEGASRSGLPGKTWGVETPFGLDLAKELQEPVLIFKSNRGGTTLNSDWLPPSTVKRSGGKVGYLYNRMISRFHNMIKDIETICPPVKERGYEIAGFVWFQGESDACTIKPEDWKDYEQKLRELIADVRRDVGVEDLPYLNVQINNIPLWDGTEDAPKGGAIIREAQKKVAEEDPKGKGRYISTSNLSKGLHYDANAHLVIGKRMAEAMAQLAKVDTPSDPKKVAAAGKAFQARAFADTKPDVNALKKGLVFYLPFDEGDKPSMKDTIVGAEGKIDGEAKHCEGLIGNGINIPVHSDRKKMNSIEFPDFKDPVMDGKIKSLSVSFWIRSTHGSVEAIAKYAREGKSSMKDGWRMIIDPDRTGMNAIIDGVPEWPLPIENPKKSKAKDGEEPRKGAPYVFAIQSDDADMYGDGVEWHHVVAVYNGEAKTMRAYADASLTLSKKHAGRNYWAKDIPGNGIVPSAEPLRIQGGQGTLAMDEFAIWDRALTEDEVVALFNNGNGVPLK